MESVLDLGYELFIGQLVFLTCRQVSFDYIKYNQRNFFMSM
jgi:hypothetical protein